MEGRMQDIKPLLVFAAVLEHGSMNAAAAALGMTPSAVSQHVGRLERQYGVKLLNRSTRRMAPTEAGRALAASCTRLLACADDAFAMLENVKTEIGGEIKIALPSGIVAHPALHNSLRRLKAEHPAIRPLLVFGDSLLDLQRDTVDIALRGGKHALDDENLVARFLTRQQWRICASPAYLAAHTVEKPQDLAALDWLYYAPANLPMHRGTDFFTLHIGQGLHCSQLGALTELVKAGFGVAIFLDGDVAADLASGRLKAVLPDWRLPEIDIYAVTPYRVQSATTETVLRILLEEFGRFEAVSCRF